MEIDIQQTAAGLTAHLAGRLDTPAALSAQKDFQTLVENADKTIVIDCTKLEYISSSGLRLFLTLRKASQGKNGKVIIENINDDIRRVFIMTGFFNLFDIK